MQMKQQQSFETFNDGICAIYALDDNKKYICTIQNIRFANRIVGSKRYFEAAMVQQQVNNVIRVPKNCNINTDNIVVIGGKQYKVIQVQQINTTRPHTTDLSLQQLNRLVTLEGLE